MRSGGTIEFHSDDPNATLLLGDEHGVVVERACVQAWGDEGSDAHWWPFGWLGACASKENLKISIDRAKSAFDRLTFFDHEPILSSEGREAAAVDYMRLASGVTDEWGISLAAPFELRIDDHSVGEGHGILHRFGELPPGLAHLGECALVSETKEDEHDWWMRPVMCVFANDLDDLTLDYQRDRLVRLGFTEEEILHLNRIALEIEEAYELETADD